MLITIIMSLWSDQDIHILIDTILNMYKYNTFHAHKIMFLFR